MISELTPLRVIWLAAALLGLLLAVTGHHPGPRGTELLAMAVLSVWCLAETMVRRNWLALTTLPGLLLGIGFALPLFLFFRSRRIA